MSDSVMTIMSSFDQPIYANTEWIEQKVDEIINKSLEEHDVFIALNACKELTTVSKLSGLGLAKFLYLIKKNWHKYNVEENFDDVVYAYIGVHKHTVDRYVKVYELIAEYAPSEVAPTLKQYNMNMLIPIANAVAEGFDVSEKQWEKILEAPDANAISTIVREEIKEIPPRKSLLLIVFHESDGTIWAWQNNTRHYVGKLEVDAEDNYVKRAIERITTNSKMIIK